MSYIWYKHFEYLPEAFVTRCGKNLLYPGYYEVPFIRPAGIQLSRGPLLLADQTMGKKFGYKNNTCWV